MKWALLFLSTTLFALPVGNPSDPALYSRGLYTCDRCLHIRLSYYGDFAYLKNMEEVIDGVRQGDAMQMRLVTNAGKLTFDINNWIDFYLILGVANAASIRNGFFVEEDDYFPSHCWSVGGALTLWEHRCFAFGIEGQYFRMPGAYNSTLNLLTGSYTYFNRNNHATWTEWQGGVGASYIFHDIASFELVPYIGIKATGGKLSLGEAMGLPHFKTNLLWGYAVGMSAAMSKLCGLTAEGRWGDESALYISGQVSF